MPKNQGTLTIDGYELGYSVESEGPTVLVLGSATFYPRLFSASLREKLKLIFIDHRGFVKSPAQKQPTHEEYSLERIVNDIERIREELGLEKLIVIGHSGHAFMAVEYAIRHPHRVEKLILLNTAPTNSEARQQQSIAYFEQFADDARKHRFSEDIVKLGPDLEKEPERRFAHVCIRMGAHSFYDYTMDAAPLWEGVYTNMPILDHLWGEAFGALDLMERLSHVHASVVLGLGAYDYLVGPTGLWDALEERHPHVRKTVFQRSGHYPMWEEPEQFDTWLLACVAW